MGLENPAPELCRVTLHAGTGQVDLALPAGVPIATLIPAVLDFLDLLDTVATRDGGRDRPSTAEAAVPYRLALPGAAPLDGSKTLAQQHIRDGSVLLLTRADVEAPGPRFDDPAELVSATVRATARPWTPAATRLTAVLVAGWLAGIGVLLLVASEAVGAATVALVAAAGAGCALVAAMLAGRAYGDTGCGLALGSLAVGLAAVGGFVAVPGPPGAPNALLAATAAAATGVLVVQVAGCSGPTMTALCWLSALVAGAALAVVLTGASAQVTGALSATAAIGLLQAAARMSIAVCGLCRAPVSGGADTTAVRAHHLLTGLVAAFATAAVLGVAGTAGAVHASGTPRFGGVAFGAASGVALLLQARSHTDRSQVGVLIAAGIGSLGVSFVAAAATAPQCRMWLGVAAGALAAATLRLGFAAPAPSPLTRRTVELLEYLALAALVPLAGWICGCYGAVRGLGLT